MFRRGCRLDAICIMFPFAVTQLRDRRLRSAVAWRKLSHTYAHIIMFDGHVTTHKIASIMRPTTTTNGLACTELKTRKCIHPQQETRRTASTTSAHTYTLCWARVAPSRARACVCVRVSVCKCARVYVRTCVLCAQTGPSFRAQRPRTGCTNADANMQKFICRVSIGARTLVH